MSKSLNLLCVHGIGHQELDPNFRASWVEAITTAIKSCDSALVPSIDFLEYDDLFEHAPLSPLCLVDVDSPYRGYAQSVRSASVSRSSAPSASASHERGLSMMSWASIAASSAVIHRHHVAAKATIRSCGFVLQCARW